MAVATSWSPSAPKLSAKCSSKRFTNGSLSSPTSSCTCTRPTQCSLMASPPPSTCHMIIDGWDITVNLISDNSDIITHLSALQHVEFLTRMHSQMPHKTHGSLILHFTDPTVTNNCIAQHISFSGHLLPAVKFMRHPPQCYNCYHMGHFACSCKLKPSCGICAGEHSTRDCSNSSNDCPPDQLAPPKCTVCRGPHKATDKDCPACRAAIYNHCRRLSDAGPFFQV